MDRTDLLLTSCLENLRILHPIGDHLWPCSRGGGCPDQQMGPHTHMLGGRDGSGRERQRWPLPKLRLPPRRHLPVSTGTRCSSLFSSSSWASIWHSLSSMLPCLSSVCRPKTASAPFSTTLSSLHTGCDCRGGKWSMLCADHGPGFPGGTPARLLPQPGWLSV